MHIFNFTSWPLSLFAGIFAYLNYLTPKKRAEILELLVNGLKRLEYRGYDSAGNKKKDNPSVWPAGNNFVCA